MRSKVEACYGIKRQPKPKRNLFACIYWLKSLLFSIAGRYIPKEDVKTYLMEDRSPLNSTIFVSSAHV